MIALNISEAAAISIVEQADYYKQASDAGLDQRWEASVDRAIHSLLQWPERGTLCVFARPRLRICDGYPSPDFPKHLVFYRYIESEKSIWIVQVLHGARNLETILGDDL